MNDLRSNNILPAWYGVVVGPLLTTAAGQGNLVLEQSSEFELHEIFGVSTEDDPNDPQSNNFSVKISDESTGRALSNIRIPQVALCAPANDGYRFLRPVIFPPLANILCDVLNLSGNTNTITIVLAGYKIYGAIQ